MCQGRISPTQKCRHNKHINE